MAKKSSPDKVVNVSWVSPTEAKAKKIRGSKNYLFIGEGGGSGGGITEEDVIRICTQLIEERAVTVATPEEVDKAIRGETE